MHNLQTDFSKLRYRHHSQGGLGFTTLERMVTLAIVGIWVAGKQASDQFFSECGLYKGKGYQFTPGMFSSLYSLQLLACRQNHPVITTNTINKPEVTLWQAVL